ncbi:MAG: penicillin-binding transpeptidase domain-containing protein [Flavobacteriales bacterium]
MRKFIWAIGLLISGLSFGQIKSFIAKEVGGKILSQEGLTFKRHSPASTFKIVIALMGYDTGILIDEYHPEWPYKEAYQARLDVWKRFYNPVAWMKNNCVWYSQLIMQKLGMEKLRSYISHFGYGNQDLSGDPGQNNGLTKSWLDNSLEISVEEQVFFIERLLDGKLLVSKRAIEYIHKLLYIGVLPKGWKLFGKNGVGNLLDEKGDKTAALGWFVGWIQKDEKRLAFAYYVEGERGVFVVNAQHTREGAKIRLVELIQQRSIHETK